MDKLSEDLVKMLDLGDITQNVKNMLKLGKYLAVSDICLIFAQKLKRDNYGIRN